MLEFREVLVCLLLICWIERCGEDWEDWEDWEGWRYGGAVLWTARLAKER